MIVPKLLEITQQFRIIESCTRTDWKQEQVINFMTKQVIQG